MHGRHLAVVGVLLLIALSTATGALLHQGAPGPIVRVMPLGRVQAGSVGALNTASAFTDMILQRQRIVVDPRARRVYVAPSPDGYDDLSGVPAGDAAIYTFSSSSGAMLARTALHGAAATLVPDAPAGRVLFLEEGLPAVGMLDAANGRLLGAVSLPYAPTALGVDERTGRAYAIGGITPTMIIIDVHERRMLASVALGLGQPEWIAADGRDGTVIVGSLMVGVAGAATTRLYTLSASSGRLLHTLTVSGAALVPAMDSLRGRLYAVRDGAVLVVDARRGVLLRVIRMAASFSAAPQASASGFVASWLLPRLAVDPRTGHLLLASLWNGHAWLLNDHRVLAKLPVHLTWSFNQIGVDDALGRFTVSDGRHILVLDARSGSVARSVPLPAGDDVAMDGGSAHAFVLSMLARRVVPADPWGWLPGGLRARLPFLPPRPTPYDTLGSVTALDLGR